MSQPEEKNLEEEEVVEATSEDVGEGPDVEGHKWYREADKAADPIKVARAY